MKTLKNLFALMVLSLVLFSSCELTAPDMEEIEDTIPYTLETDEVDERDKKPGN